MKTAFSFGEGWHHGRGRGSIGLGVYWLLSENFAPTRLEDFFSGSFEFYFASLAQYGGCGVLTVGMEGGDEASGNKIEYMLFGIG